MSVSSTATLRRNSYNFDEMIFLFISFRIF